MSHSFEQWSLVKLIWSSATRISNNKYNGDHDIICLENMSSPLRSQLGPQLGSDVRTVGVPSQIHQLVCVKVLPARGIVLGVVVQLLPSHVRPDGPGCLAIVVSMCVSAGGSGVTPTLARSYIAS